MAFLDFIGGTPGNYLLGRGKVYAQAEFSNTPTGWRDLGNCSAFTLTQESEKKEHQSFLTGIKTIDLEVPISTKVSVAFTLDEVTNFLNLAQFLSGSLIGYTGLMLPTWNGFSPTGEIPNAAAVASDDTATWGAGPFTAGTKNFVKAAGTVYPGLWYDIEMEFALGVGTWRAYNFDSTQTFTVKKNSTSRDATTGTSAGTEGVDYEIDRKMGRIRMLVWNSADLLLVKWTAPSVARQLGGSVAGLDAELKSIKLLTSSGLTVALKFVLENPNNSIPIEFEMFKVKLSPDGDLALIGDDWGSMQFTGVLSTIASPPLGASPYGRITARQVMVS